ncbi:tRNA 2-selenouridine(34) synthase MnmH [Dethiobacter alkaliphilus]|uniref:tRNA 2-selenouridine(34) synthase MnmH n=1 Tax=Dethiobacter alkaliphilus TaxID=427926 RepID=UPI002226F906|nr:tRNA 2-selenouridine(34) synthase MnmH [Dethiobacter alkaliphilus]MCW3489850.1 tRNA 2-selenouridine(34) synthase MnmH [Dethiobacter alkaliphilus]
MKSLLTVEQFIKNREQYLLVDVRSPGEFSLAHIPGAVNIPLFSDEERALVGTTYWKEGTDRAKLVGLSLVGPRLPGMVEEMLESAAGRDIVLYCWRGGMRSGSVFSVMEALGYPAWQLVGGYKAFRRHVVRYLKSAEIKMPVFILNGLTGVGKTLVIKELQRKGAPTIDLERLANHRGSAFGGIGLGKPRTQKDFEAHLFFALKEIETAPYVLLEGEGKKVGPVVLPDFLYSAMHHGEHILLEADLEIRVDRIIKEYHGIDESVEPLADAALMLQKKLGQKKCSALANQIRQGELRPAAMALCSEYYDQYYRDSQQNIGHYLAVVDVNDIQRGAAVILAVVTEYLQKGESSGSI